MRIPIICNIIDIVVDALNLVNTCPEAAESVEACVRVIKIIV